MIGHYLLTLTEEQEDRVLTVPFGPIYGRGYLTSTYSGCLMCAVTNTNWGPECVIQRTPSGGSYAPQHEPGFLYEKLVVRFGTPRVNAAIRNRILSNRARRILGNALVGAGPQTPGDHK